MTTTSTSSTAPASGSADFSTISPAAFALAAQHGFEIVSNSAGFNVWRDGDLFSADCSAAEIEQWLEGYDSAKDDVTHRDASIKTLQLSAGAFREVISCLGMARSGVADNLNFAIKRMANYPALIDGFRLQLADLDAALDQARGAA